MAWDELPPQETELNIGWDATPPKPEELPKSGPMDTLPQMLSVASGIGVPNMANQTFANIVGEDKVNGPIGEPLKNDTAGLQDVTIPDALTAASIITPVVKGAGNFMAPQLERMGRNQTLKGLGGSMSQIRQMATKGDMEAAARYANEKGLNDVFSTSLGRENLLKDLEQKTGSTLGGLREQAGTAVGLKPAEIQAKIMESPQMQKYMGKGLHAGESTDIGKALEDIKRIGGEAPSHAGLAQAATELNKSAAGSKLYQPQNAVTDVANILSKENNAGIAASLGPDKAEAYKQALNEYSQIEPLKHLQERGELREMAGRTSGGLYHGLKQGLSDLIGHRASAKGAYQLADVAGTAAKAPNLSPALLAQQLKDYLEKKYGSQ